MAYVPLADTFKELLVTEPVCSRSSAYGLCYKKVANVGVNNDSNGDLNHDSDREAVNTVSSKNDLCPAERLKVEKSINSGNTDWLFYPKTSNLMYQNGWNSHEETSPKASLSLDLVNTSSACHSLNPWKTCYVPRSLSPTKDYSISEPLPKHSPVIEPSEDHSTPIRSTKHFEDYSIPIILPDVFSQLSEAPSEETSRTNADEFSSIYFNVLKEETVDRCEEAVEFLSSGDPNLRRFEFHVKIIDDLLEELDDLLLDHELEDYESVEKLRERLRDVKSNLIVRRHELLLRYRKSIFDENDQESETVIIGPPEELEDYCYATADDYLEEVRNAKVKRLRQCQILLTIQKISEFSAKEEEYRQRRLDCESELNRLFKEETIELTSRLGGASDAGATIAGRKSDSISERRKSSSPCIFCGEFHSSHLCLKKPTLEERKIYYRDRNLCRICGKSHNGTCSGGDRICRWPQCRAKNAHHTALCPKVTYPITEKNVEEYHLRQLHNHVRASKCRITPVTDRILSFSSTVNKLLPGPVFRKRFYQ